MAEREHARFSDSVLARVGEVLRLAGYARIEQRCREGPPAEFQACMAERLARRREVLRAMSAYLGQGSQGGCYAECAAFRHEAYKQLECVLACQRRVYLELDARLDGFVASCAALLA